MPGGYEDVPEKVVAALEYLKLLSGLPVHPRDVTTDIMETALQIVKDYLESEPE